LLVLAELVEAHTDIERIGRVIFDTVEAVLMAETAMVRVGGSAARCTDHRRSRRG
jgi:hypothetical protein